MMQLMNFQVMHDFTDQQNLDRKTYRAMTPAERLDLVETLRLSSGKFICEYPARLRRVFVPVAKAQR